MSPLRNSLFVTGVLLSSACAIAGDASFTGTWAVDVRSQDERSMGMECGEAKFVLTQVGKSITGSHMMSTPGCGRLNEGGAGTVKGTVSGKKAALRVTSGRNGAVVSGVATLVKSGLRWEVTKEINAGSPAGDFPLILQSGLLKRVIP